MTWLLAEEVWMEAQLVAYSGLERELGGWWHSPQTTKAKRNKHKTLQATPSII